MEFIKSHSRPYRRRIAYLLRLVLNVIHYVTESYVINKLTVDSVANDLGASFTAITRKKGRLVKRANPDGEAKLRDEIEWILRFRDTELARYLPQIYEYSLEPGNVFYTLRYYDYPNLRRIVLMEMNARFFVRLRLLHLLEVLERELWTEANGIATPPDFVENEYFVKFDTRREAALGIDPYFANFYDSPDIVVNGKHYVNAQPLLAAIRADERAFASLRPEKLYISHGDLHSNNILCGISNVRMILIDCRGKSSAGIPYFDPAYDLAKLFHDFRGGYSLIERHSYSIFHRLEAKPIIDYRFLDERSRNNFRDFYAFIRAVAQRRLTRFGNILQRADFAEALLFLTMIPMHMRNRDEALMCYSVGVKELNDWCQRQFPDLYGRTRRSVGIEGDD